MTWDEVCVAATIAGAIGFLAFVAHKWLGAPDGVAKFGLAALGLWGAVALANGCRMIWTAITGPR